MLDAAWEYPIVEPALTCEQASYISHKAMERLGYTVTAFAPATTDKVGEIRGARVGTWGEKEPVVVALTCAADGVRITAYPEIPPCEQGNRISRLAIERSGYAVTEFTPAAIGKPGIVKGTQKGQQPAVITLFCAPNQNVVMETRMDSPLLKKEDFYLAISNFYQGFFVAFKAERGVVARERAQPVGDQVQVTMKPLNLVESKIAFGTEVSQVLPIQVEISNPTKHSYQLEVDKIVLLSSSGERVKPVGEKSNVPVQALSSQTVAPGASVKGYLYYPAGSYTGARGFLVEEKSQEREGFDVQF
jgi:hypothetical protein